MGRIQQSSTFQANGHLPEALIDDAGRFDLIEKIDSLMVELRASRVQESRIDRPVDHKALARKLYASRRKVDDIFDFAGFAASPGWDIILDLYQLDRSGRRASVTDACIGSACPSTTGLRWLQALEGLGLIGRSSDPNDKRRTYVNLTQKGREAAEKALEAFTRL